MNRFRIIAIAANAEYLTIRFIINLTKRIVSHYSQIGLGPVELIDKMIHSMVMGSVVIMPDFFPGLSKQNDLILIEGCYV